MSEAAVRHAFDVQAEWARKLGAGFTERLIEALAAVIDRSTAIGERLLDWPGDPVADALVLRLLGGLHALVRAGARPELAAAYPPHPLPDAAALRARLAAALTDARLLPWLDSPPQTNEVGRSGVLMPGLLTIMATTGLPLRLFELGASAGLNLRVGDYAYDLGGVQVGAAHAPLRLAPAWSGPPPPPGRVEVVARAGVDRAPIDLRRDADRLLAYVWPDQPERIVRLEAAIAAFTADPVVVDRQDAADWVEAQVATAAGTVTVVYHTIAFQYFSGATQARVAAHLAAIGATATAAAPLAWLRFEFESGDGSLPTLCLRLWPGGEDRLLARAHPHGASVTWFG